MPIEVPALSPTVPPVRTEDAGYLSPVGGAVAQEIIDLAAVLNAARVAIPAKALTDF